MTEVTSSMSPLLALATDAILEVAVTHGAAAALSRVCRELRDLMAADDRLVRATGAARAFERALAHGRPDVAERAYELFPGGLGSGGSGPRFGPDGLTAFELAACGGHLSLVEAMVDDDVEMVEQEPVAGGRFDALQIAAVEGHAAVVDTILRRGGRKYRVDAGSSVDKRPMFLAAVEGQGDVVRVLYDHWADVEERVEHFGWTALHVAVAFGNADCVRALVDGCGADVDAVDDVYRCTPLHYAVIHGRPDALRTLLERRARVDARDLNGDTPLMLAARGGAEHAEVVCSIVRALLEHGADPEALDAVGRTPARILRGVGGSPDALELLCRF